MGRFGCELPVDQKFFTAVPKKFSQAGTFDLYFCVRDGEGNEVRGKRKLTVSTQVPKITSLEKNAEITAGDFLTFAGEAEVNSGTLKRFTWSYGDGTPAASGALNAAKASVAGGHRFATAGGFTVTLTIEDDAGVTVSDQLSVKVNPKSGPKPPVADAGMDTSILLARHLALRGRVSHLDQCHVQAGVGRRFRRLSQLRSSKGVPWVLYRYAVSK